MPDEPTAEAPAQESILPQNDNAPEPAKPNGAVSGDVFGDGLAFKEGWRESLTKGMEATDPHVSEILENKKLGLLKNLPDLLKTVVALDKMVGADKIPKPGKDATQEQLHEFYTQIGKPDDPSKYNLDFGEQINVPEGLSKEIAQDLFDGNFTESNVETLQKVFNKFVESGQIEQEQRIKQLQLDFHDKITKLWGDAYRSNETQFNEFVQLHSHGDFNLGEVLVDSGLNMHAGFVNWFVSDIISRMTEDREVMGTGQPMTPGNARKEMMEILEAAQNDPNHEYRTNPAMRRHVENLAKASAGTRQR